MKLHKVFGLLAIGLLSLGLFAVGCAGTVPAGSQAAATDPREADLAGARAVFDANLAAIQNEDTEGYLNCYWQDPALTRNGPGGPSHGYSEWAKGVGGGWPEVFEGTHLDLTWLREGVVYGSYRYRVRFSGQEATGISERVFLKTEQGWKIAVTTAFGDLPGTPPPALVLQGATVFVGDELEPAENAVVVIRNGLIDCVGRDCDIPETGVELFDATGMWIIPGLIDTHVQYSQTGGIDTSPSSFDLRDVFDLPEIATKLKQNPERIHKALLGSGVTTVLDVGGYPWTFDLAADSTNTEAPRVYATGPAISFGESRDGLPAERRTLEPSNMRSDVRELVRYLHGAGAHAVCFRFSPVMPPYAGEYLEELADEAAGFDLPVLVETTEMLHAVRSIPLKPRLMLRSVESDPFKAEMVQLMIGSGASFATGISVPHGYNEVFQIATKQKKFAIDDPHAVVHSDFLKFGEVMPSIRRRLVVPENESLFDEVMNRLHVIGTQNAALLHRKEAPLVLGTDSGSPFVFHGPAVFFELENLQKAGIDAPSLLQVATINGARALGIDHQVGSLDSGKVADMVILKKDPTKDISHLRSLQYVVRGGELRSVDEFRQQ